METLKAEFTEFQSVKDLKPILNSTGPCLSVYMALDGGSLGRSGKANSLEWQELLRDIQPKLAEFGSKGQQLLEGVSDWDTLIQDQEPKGKSIGIFRSPDLLQATWIEEEVSSRAIAGPRFYVRPLLKDLTRDSVFYLLALSQKSVRLLRCTTRAVEEVEFPSTTSTNIDAYENLAKPDHVSDNRSSPGPSAGTSKGVMFGTSSDREDRGEYLAHFYRQIDRGVNEALRGKSEPLVLVGVEYEIALYRSLNKYPHLAKESVQGAPNSLKSGEMHGRALEAIARCYDHKVDEKLAEYDHKVGGGASNHLKEIVPAAHDGRVLTLLVSESLEAIGAFDETTDTVKGRETGTAEDEDLVNDAVVQTILHAGQVFVVPNSKMPHGAPLAAIYRF